jgi:hypothetical protein
MATLEQQMAAALVNQALASLMTYIQQIAQAKQDGLTEFERWMLVAQGTTMVSSLAMPFMLAPPAVLAAMPAIAPYVRVVLPPDGPVPCVSRSE